MLMREMRRANRALVAVSDSRKDPKTVTQTSNVRY